jgi:teichuronic acid biosynthesis glycosyltransferase TuaC
MSQMADVRVLQPIPTFPLIRPLPAWARPASRTWQGLTIAQTPMFYFPKVAKALDATWQQRAVSRHLQRAQAKGAIDLVDAHFGYPDGVGCVRAAQKAGLPVFVTIRGLEAERVRDPRIGPALVKALNEATGVISVSHFLRQDMIDNGVSGDQIEVIANAVDRSVFKTVANKGEAKQALGLDPSRKLVISIGHQIHRKRHDIVLRAFAQLCGQRSDVDLAIVGGVDFDTDTPAMLQRLVQELQLQTKVRFLGTMPPPEVAKWLQAADVFALATLREGCCNAVLEALACGVPVVTTPVGDNAYYVKEGENGHLFAVNNVAELSAALQRSLHTTWNTEGISQGLVVGTWQNVAEKVLASFQRRLATKLRRGASA